MDVSKLQIGDVGFTFDKTSLLSKLIFAISNWKKKLKKPEKKLSHAFIYIGDGLIAEATSVGIVIVNIEKYSDPKYTVEFQTAVGSLNQQEKELVFNIAAKQAGIIKYSYGQLFVIFFNKIFKTKNFDFSCKQMMCSEFISNIYEKLNRKLTEKENSMNSPLDVYDSDKLKDI